MLSSAADQHPVWALIMLPTTVSLDGYPSRLLVFSFPLNSDLKFSADIVPPDLRTTIYAFDRAFEGSLSALAAPLVGVLAEVMYGYKFDVLKASEPSPTNARALSNGLFACMAPSFGICAATYGLLYRTYQKDKDRVDAKVYKDRERRPLKMEEVSTAAFSL